MKKEKIFELVEIFGLIVDLDRWEEKGWLRISDKTWKEFRSLIIYKDDVIKSPPTFVQEELQNHLISLGEYNHNLKIKKLLGI